MTVPKVTRHSSSQIPVATMQIASPGMTFLNVVTRQQHIQLAACTQLTTSVVVSIVQTRWGRCNCCCAHLDAKQVPLGANTAVPVLGRFGNGGAQPVTHSLAIAAGEPFHGTTIDSMLCPSRASTSGCFFRTAQLIRPLWELSGFCGDMLQFQPQVLTYHVFSLR